MVVRNPCRPLPLLVAAFLFAACGSGGGDSTGGSGGAAGGAGTGGTGGGGSGGDGGTGGTGGQVPTVVDVEGVVVDGDWQPVSGARVALNGGLGQAVTTGADGRFTFADVDTPYDLAVEKGRTVYELRGLTRAEPVIPLASGWVAKRQATIAGAVTGPELPLPNGDSILLSLGADTSAMEAEGDGTFEASFGWFGPAERTSELAAVQVRVQSNGSLECLAAGARTDVSLTHGAGSGDLSIELLPVTDAETQQATIEIDYGAYTSFSSTRVAWFDLDGRRFRPRNTGWIPSRTTAKLPKHAGIALVANDAKERGVWRIVPVASEAVTTISLPVEAPLRAIEPAENARDVSSTPTLTWTEVPGARTYWVTVGNLSFILPGTTHSLEIGAYEAWNAGLEGGSGMGWEVTAFLDEGFSADDVTDGKGMGIERRVLLDELTMYTSGLGWFLTAP